MEQKLSLQGVNKFTCCSSATEKDSLKNSSFALMLHEELITSMESFHCTKGSLERKKISLNYSTVVLHTKNKMVLLRTDH